MIESMLFSSASSGEVVTFNPESFPLKAGTTTAGWYGEVTPAEFITHNELLSKLDLGTNQGVLLNADPGWLHFGSAGKHLLVSKMPLRTSIAWMSLNNIGAIAGGKVLNIRGKQYKLRLFTGTTGAGTVTAGGEWNALMYNIVTGAPSTQGWTTYAAADLGIKAGSPGNYTLCQEKFNSGDSYCIRGTAISGITGASSSAQDVRFAWRPVLELVP